MIILIIDCENRKIFMTNERTNGHYELDVDVNNEKSQDDRISISLAISCQFIRPK